MTVRFWVVSSFLFWLFSAELEEGERKWLKSGVLKIIKLPIAKMAAESVIVILAQIIRRNSRTNLSFNFWKYENTKPRKEISMTAMAYKKTSCLFKL
jgi:hypothetical protein